MRADDEAMAREAWQASADGWIAAMGDRGDATRALLLDAPMLEMVGDVTGKRVLDVGCGEGRFCRMMTDRGARITGIDPTIPLLGIAATGEGLYARAVGESLPFADASFDLAVTYLTLIDIPDYRTAIREIFRVLAPGGKVAVANLNPFATTRPAAWYRNDAGEPLHVAVEDYFDEKATLLRWGKINIYNWHRPMEAYMQAFLEAGFVLERFAEPRASLDVIDANPNMAEGRRVPLFHIMRWRKGG